MSSIQGTNIIAPVVPFTTDDTYPTHYAQYGKGGWKAVMTTADRDAIPATRLENGAVVYVVADLLAYVYVGSSWIDLVSPASYGLASTADASGLTRSDVVLTPASISPLINGITAGFSNAIAATTAELDQKADADFATPDDVSAASSETLIVSPSSMVDVLSDIDISAISAATNLITIQRYMVEHWAFV